MNRPLTSLIALAAAGVLASAPMMASAQSAGPQGLNSGGASEQGNGAMTNKADQPPTMNQVPNTADRPAQPGAQGGASTGPATGKGSHMNGGSDHMKSGAGKDRMQRGTGAGTTGSTETGPAAAPGDGTRVQQETAGQSGMSDTNKGNSGSQQGERSRSAPPTSGQAASEPLMNNKDRTGSLGER